MSSVQETNVAAVKLLCDIVNTRELDRMDDLFTSNFKDNNPAWSVASIAELKGIIAAALKCLDQYITQDMVLPVDDKVVVLLTLRGTHIGDFLGIPATNKEVTWTSIEIFRFEDGKIAERWVQADTAGLMRQLGVELPG
jgi:predicted ester cyclase